MNFSLRLACVSPSMRLMNSPVVDILWGCDSSILRSREKGRKRNHHTSARDKRTTLKDVWPSLVSSPPSPTRTPERGALVQRRLAGQGGEQLRGYTLKHIPCPFVYVGTTTTGLQVQAWDSGDYTGCPSAARTAFMAARLCSRAHW